MNKLEKLLKKKKISKYKLAQLLGMKQTVSIYAWMKSTNPSTKYLIKLCEILGCTPADLIHK